MEQLLKSVLDQDRAPVVICDVNHVIKYMNEAAIARYSKQGGKSLIGKSLFACHNKRSQEMITRIINWFDEDNTHNMIYTFRNDEENKDVYMVALRAANGKLIGYYEKHEYRDRETADIYDFSKSLI